MAESLGAGSWGLLMFYKSVGIALGYICNHCGIMSCCTLVGIPLGLYWDHLGILLGLVVDSVGIIAFCF